MAGDRRIGRLCRRAAGAAVLLALTGLAPGRASPRASLRPDLVEAAVAVSTHVVQAGGTLRVTDAVRNRGGARAPRSTTGYYLSRDRARGPGDLRLGRRAVNGLGPGASARVSAIVAIPASTRPGTWRVLACADDRGRLRESDERNNCRAAPEAVVVTRRSGLDRTPPAFAGLAAAATCIPGPGDPEMSARYRLAWDPAADDVTPSSAIVYDVYQAITPGGEDFSAATYTTAAGASSFATPSLPGNRTYYFVVRARDEAGNRDANRVERAGVNLCD